MTYVDLHQHCSGLEPYIKRAAIYDGVLKIKGIQRVAHVIMDLDPTVCRGLYLSARNTNHPFVRQNGGHVIATARGLTPVWQRFVFIKELMHVFDDPDEATDSGDAFENLLSEFTQPSAAKWSPQMEAEIDSFWMATSVICPEPSRKELATRVLDDPTQLQVIAKEVGIPDTIVARLFSATYEQTITNLLAK